MKNIVIAVLAVSSFSALANTQTASDPFSGHRIGIGHSSVEFIAAGYTIDAGNGVKLEYGYDINRVFGLNFSYAKNTDAYSNANTSVDYDGTSFKIDTDIGYAFDLEGWAIKPYGAIGLTRYNEETTFSVNGNSESVTFNDSSLHLGVGARAQFDMGVYADLRFDFTTVDSIDTDYLSFTVGYKF